MAWHVGQVGGWAQLVTRIGDDDDGRRAVEKLDPVVDTSLVQIDPERATGEVTVRLQDGEPKYTLVTGRAWERIACTPDVEEALSSAGVFVYGTLALRTAEGLDGWRRAEAASRSCLRVYDVNLRPSDKGSNSLKKVLEEALAAADVVKLNDAELVMLHEWLGWTNPIEKLLTDKRRVVALTHGARGSTLHGEHGACAIAGVPAARTGGDNVGCGDAFLAVLVHGLTLGWDLAASGRAASRYASAVACVRGATPVFDDARCAELLNEG